MRRQIVRSPFTVLILFYLISYGIFFFYSIFSFPTGSGGLLAVFQWPYVWSNSFILFMRYCIPVTIASVAVAYSLLPGGGSPRPRAGSLPFSRIVNSHLVTFVVLAVIYTALVIGLDPVVHSNMEQFSSLSRQAELFLERADAALETGDEQAALHGYRRYLAIDRGNRRVLELVDDLQMKIIAEAPAEQEKEADELEDLRIKDLAEGKAPYELLALAEQYYQREDYFSAHYYANLAFTIDPSRRDAQRLAAQAREMIVSKDLSQMEAEEKRLFEKKRVGYEQFVNEEFFKAYHTFRELKESYPDDADVNSYLLKSQTELSRETFFLEEARAIDPMPGAMELLFLNYNQDGEREVVFIEKVVSGEEGMFCKDIEVARFNNDGLLFHYYAPYGKLTRYVLEEGEGKARDKYRINLHGVGKASRQEESLPRYLSGALRLRSRELPYELALSPNLEQLSSLNAAHIGSPAASSIGFFTLWQLRGSVEQYGYLEPFVSAEILRRMLLPFSFLVLSLFCVSLGWRFRARFSGSPRWILLVFMPLFPLVGVVFTSLYLQAQRIILAFVLLRLTFFVSLVVFLGLQALLLLVVMIMLAGQRAD